MITKRVTIGHLGILEDGQLQIRTDTVIEEDGIELSRTYHRRVISPGDNVTSEDKKVRDIASLIWTQEIVDGFLNKKSKINNLGKE